MSASTGQAEEAQDESPKASLAGLVKTGRSIYQHIAAVFAAFGLAALLGHFWDIGWRGFLLTLVGVWDATVRPAVAFVFHIIVTVPLEWVGLHFEVPLPLRDYISVGLIVAISGLRARRGGTAKLIGDEGSGFLFLDGGIVGNTLGALAWPISISLLPAALYWTFLQARTYRDIADNLRKRKNKHMSKADKASIVHLEQLSSEYRREGRAASMTLLPLPYLALLLALNFLVMPYIS